MRRRVSGSMTVNVTEASIDMFTPPCSPNSCRALASEVAGLKTVPFCVAVASFFFCFGFVVHTVTLGGGGGGGGGHEESVSHGFSV